MTNKPTYAELLEIGKHYEQWVSDLFKKSKNFDIGLYLTQEEQLYGECEAGIEIKLDRLWRNTNNLFIEINERTEESVEGFTPSGIYRDDNTFLYLIGDYGRFWIFRKDDMQGWFETRAYPVREVRSRGFVSGHGFLFPIKHADQSCIHRWDVINGWWGAR